MNLLDNQKLSFSLQELYRQIEDANFEVNRCKYDKKRDRFQATAKNESGVELEAFGPNERYALTNLLHSVVHHNARKSQKIARWKTTFEDQIKEIAEGYAKAPAYERKAANAFVELAAECRTKADVIKKQIAITLANNPVPYTDPEKMFDDIRKRRKLEVSKAGSENHPIWSREDVINFRICMDVLGHAAAHAGYDWEGLNQAFATFAALLPEIAQGALFTEVLGQGAHASFYRAYGPAKICLLNKFIAEAQQTENPHKGYRGVHPSQILIPHDVPEAKASKIAKKLETKDGIVPFDINDGWVSPYENHPKINYLLDYPDFLNVRDAGDKLEKLHTDWANPIKDSDDAHVREEWRMYKVDDPEGALHIKQAVGNALKAAILMQDHGLGHAAIQYQDLLDKNSADPEDYWKTLEDKRSEYNSSRFGGQTAHEHRPWLAMDEKGDIPLMALASRVSEHDGDHPEKAISNAHRLVHEMHTRMHKKAKDDDNGTDEDKYEKNNRTEDVATEQVMRYLDTILDGGGKFDHWTHTSAKTDSIKPHKYEKSFKALDNHKVFNLQRYPSVHGDHLQLISKLIKHLDQITEEALVDVHSHDGQGHHFRAYVMSLEEIDPQTVGKAWLLLQPLTSQLSMISEDMQGALSHHGSDKASRNYFLHERSLMAHRDSMGLEHIPLGHFNYAVNGVKGGEHISSGGSIHQDLSAFKVKDPEAAWRVPLAPEGKPTYTFNLTHGIEKPIEEEWNKSVATKFAPDEVPHKSVRPFAMFTSAAQPDPLYKFLDRIGPQYEMLSPFIHYLYNSGNAQPLADGNFQFRMPGQEDWKDLSAMLPNLSTLYKSSPQFRTQIDQLSNQPLDPKVKPLKIQNPIQPKPQVAPKPKIQAPAQPSVEAIPIHTQQPEEESEESEESEEPDDSGWNIEDALPTRNPYHMPESDTEWSNRPVVDPNDDVDWGSDPLEQDPDRQSELNGWTFKDTAPLNKPEYDTKPTYIRNPRQVINPNVGPEDNPETGQEAYKRWVDQAQQPVPKSYDNRFEGPAGWTTSPINQNQNRTIPNAPITWKGPDGWEYTSGWDFNSGFEEVVDQYAPYGLSCLYDETPTQVDISHVEVANKGTGIGSQFMQAAQNYCEENGKQLQISRVDNQNFFSKFPFLEQTDPKTFQGLVPSAV